MDPMLNEVRLRGDIGIHASAIACYLAIALLFWWPLPLHLLDALPGPASGDTGVYVWNLWLFRHEIVAHQSFPFETLEILNAGSGGPLPLSLHNYTPFADALALPLIGWIGLVPTFNTLIIGNCVLTAYAMFLYARSRTGDSGAAFAGGLLFGFSPYMMARATEHFSLAQAAPLPIFGLLMLKTYQRPTTSLAALAGVTVAWAYMSDPYYAVYCLMMALFTVTYSLFSIEPRGEEFRQTWTPTALTLGLLCSGGLILGMLLTGGGDVNVLGTSISVRRLYTPMLVFTALLISRVLATLRQRVTWQMPFRYAHLRAGIVTAAICLLALTPVLYAMASPWSGHVWAAPPVWWRSSAPGIDLAAWFVPNPMHPWFTNLSRGWLYSLPNGYVENIASIPWTAVGLIIVTWRFTGFRGAGGWWAFLIVFGLLSLGPFIRVASQNTFVPTPWAVIRYLPILGAARMPTRLTILVMLAVAMLVSLALAQLREATGRPGRVLFVALTLLLLELLPAPRELFPATIPGVTRIIASDPRAIRVLNLPFGFKDGLGSRGGFSTAYQYYQTAHGKPLIGGYLSRLPPGASDWYRQSPTLRVLLRLSEQRPAGLEMINEALLEAPRFVRDTRIGYVLVDRERAPAELVAFAERALSLTLIAEDSGFALYQTAFSN
jgi:hypothetical protein